MANKYIDRQAGNETIGNAARHDSNAEVKIPSVQEPEYATTNFSRYVDNIFPHKPSVDGLLQGLDREMLRIESDINKRKAKEQRRRLNILNMEMLNLDSHINEFSQEYLRANPDGKGLQSAVLKEMKSSIVGLAINTEDKEIQDIILPKFQHFIAGHSNKAMIEEASATDAFYRQEASYRISDIVRGVSAGDPTKYEQYRALLDNEFALLDSELGEGKAKGIKNKFEAEFQKAYGLGLIEKDAGHFIAIASAGGFKGQFSPGMFDYLKAKAGNEYQKQQAKLKMQSMQLLKKQLSETQRLQANAVFTQISQDPFSYTADDIQKLNLPFNYTKSLIKHQQQILKGIATTNIERDIAQDMAINGFGASSQDVGLQRSMVENMVPSNNKGVVHPKDRLKVANMLGTSNVDRARSTALEIDMFNTNDTKKCKMLYETFKEAIQTRNNIYGDLNDVNVSLAHDFIDFVDAMTDGRNIDDKTLVALRNNFKETIRKNKNIDVINYAKKTAKGELENKEYADMFQEIKDRFEREHPEYQEGYYGILRSAGRWLNPFSPSNTSNAPSNGAQIREKLEKIPEEVSRLENRGIPRDVAKKMAYNKLINRMDTSILNDNKELMYMPPEYTVAGCMADNVQRKGRINNLKLRHVYLCEQIVRSINDKAPVFDFDKETVISAPGIKAIRYKNKPTITYDKKDAMIMLVPVQDNQQRMIAQKRLTPIVNKYSDPLFVVTFTDGRIQDMNLRYVYDDNKRRYNAFFYNPKTQERLYLRHTNGKRLTIDYNHKRFLSLVDKAYIRYEALPTPKANNKVEGR